MLAEVAAAHGKSFCKFDESKNVKDARYVPSDIADNHPVAMGLYTLSPQLKFKRTTMEAAVAEVLEKNNDKWKVKDKSDYIETMTRRLQNLTHAISKGLDAQKPPKWVDKLPWRKDQDTSCEGNPKFVYGWDPDMQLPYREKIEDGLKDCPVEHGLPIERTADDCDEDPVRAKFKDGTIAEISELTYADLVELSEKSKSSSSKGEDALYKTKHKNSNVIRITQRRDRALLVSIYEQGRDIYRVRADAFGPLPHGTTNEKIDNNHPSIQGALEFLRPLADKYAREELTLEQLCQTEKPKPQKANAKTKTMDDAQPLKRPASSESDDAQPMKRPAAVVDDGLKDRPASDGDATSALESPSTGKADSDVDDAPDHDEDHEERGDEDAASNGNEHEWMPPVPLTLLEHFG